MTNKSAIFTTAWKLAKSGQSKFGGKVKEYFATALKISYTSSKFEFYGFKSWFKLDSYMPMDDFQLIIGGSDTVELVAETEKAVLLKFVGFYGNFAKTWAPKSALMTMDDVKEKCAFQENALNKYEKLIEWAKANGAKVRKRMKKVTLLKKINEAGLTAPVELV